MGMREYFLFDPYSETSYTTLRGFRLEGGEYTPMHGPSLKCEVLGLELRVEDGLLRLHDPKRGIGEAANDKCLTRFAPQY